MAMNFDFHVYQMHHAPFCAYNGGIIGLISGCLQLQEMSSNAAKYARLWIKRAKEAAWQGKTHMRMNLGFCVAFYWLLLL